MLRQIWPYYFNEYSGTDISNELNESGNTFHVGVGISFHL